MQTVKISPIWTVIFLAPSFIQRLFIGGEGLSYDEFAGVSLAALGYVTHSAIALRYGALPVVPGQSGYVIRHWIFIAVLSAGHALMLMIEHPPGAELGLGAILRQLLWIFACLAMSALTTPDELLRRLVQFTHATFLIITLTYVAYKFSGFPLQILLSDGEPRAQGLLSEPSGVGSLIAGYVGLATWQGRWWRLLLAAVVVFMAYSVIGFMGFLVGFVLGFARRHVSSRSIRRTIALAFLCVLPLAFFAIPLLANPISEMARSALQSPLVSDLQENVLYRGFGDRILQALSVLDAALKIVANGDNISAGALFRFTSVLLMLEHLQQSHHLWVGYGLGVHAQLMLKSLDTILDFGLLPFLLSSFGLLGGLVLFAWLAATLTRSESELSAYALPFAVISFVNSAGGIHMYSVLLLSAFLIDQTHRRRKVVQLSVHKNYRSA